MTNANKETTKQADGLGLAHLKIFDDSLFWI